MWRVFFHRISLSYHQRIPVTTTQLPPLLSTDYHAGYHHRDLTAWLGSINKPVTSGYHMATTRSPLVATDYHPGCHPITNTGYQCIPWLPALVTTLLPALDTADCLRPARREGGQAGHMLTRQLGRNAGTECWQEALQGPN